MLLAFSLFCCGCGALGIRKSFASAFKKNAPRTSENAQLRAFTAKPKGRSFRQGIYLSIYICVYMCKSEYLCKCVYVCTCVCVYVCVYVCMCVCVYVCMCVLKVWL